MIILWYESLAIAVFVISGAWLALHLLETFLPRTIEDSDPNKFLNLEGLRGVLAFAVFLHHAANSLRFIKTGTWDSLPIYRALGPVPVTGFFFLTSFLFWSQIQNGRVAERSVYFIKRARRILPAYWFTVIIIVLICFWKKDFVFQESPITLLAGICSWLFIGFSLMGFQKINGFDRTVFVNAGVAWTLYYECCFYVIIYAFRRARGLSGVIIYWLIFGLLFVLIRQLEFMQNSLPEWFAYSDLRKFAKILLSGFGIGIAMTYFVKKVDLRKLAASHQAQLFCTFLLAGIISCTDDYAFRTSMSMVPIFLLLFSGMDFWGFLRREKIVFLGKISYSLYLIHGIGLFLLSDAILKSQNPLSRDPLVFAVFASGVSFAVVLLAAALHHFVEVPFYIGRSVRNLDRAPQT